jgi:hypothetical protein
MQRVLVGSTESILSYPRLSDDVGISTGVPSDPATARRISSQYPDADGVYVAATIDSLSTTTQGACSEGDDRIPLAASVAIVAGRRYLVTDSASARPVVVVAARGGTLATMWLAEPLPCDLGNASTVRGLAVSVALDAVQTGEPGAGYVLFRATVDGVVREWDESFRVVRRITSVALTPTELTQSYPVVRQIASSSDLTLEEAIQASWRMVMVPALAARGILDEDVLTDDVLVPMHASATVLHLARQWPAAPAEFVERLSTSYEQTKQTTWDRIDLITRSQEEETPDVPTPGSQTTRYMRLSR